jgi:hypothetical protein
MPCGAMLMHGLHFLRARAVHHLCPGAEPQDRTAAEMLQVRLVRRTRLLRVIPAPGRLSANQSLVAIKRGSLVSIWCLFLGGTKKTSVLGADITDSDKWLNTSLLAAKQRWQFDLRYIEASNPSLSARSYRSDPALQEFQQPSGRLVHIRKSSAACPRGGLFANRERIRSGGLRGEGEVGMKCGFVG